MNPTAPVVPSLPNASGSRTSGWGIAAAILAGVFALALLAGAFLFAIVLFLGVRSTSGPTASSVPPPSAPIGR